MQAYAIGLVLKDKDGAFVVARTLPVPTQPPQLFPFPKARLNGVRKRPSRCNRAGEVGSAMRWGEAPFQSGMGPLRGPDECRRVQETGCVGG